MRYSSTEQRWDYYPPLLGNGRINLHLDGEGTQNFSNAAFFPGNPSLPGQAIWWAGHRYRDTSGRELIPFGRLIHNLSAPLSFTQALDPQGAVCETLAAYPGGLSVETQAFICQGSNLLALRKHFAGEAPVPYALTYLLAGPAPDTALPRRMAISASAANGRIDIRYQADGQAQYAGRIRFFADQSMEALCQGNAFTLQGVFEPGVEITFYLLLEDDETPALDAESLLAQGYPALRKRHEDTYPAGGFIRLGEPLLEGAYQTAKYHLRCVATPWSVPTGLCDTHWHGRYFAFDEYFNVSGLLSAGLIEEARRVVNFRFAHLEQSMRRCSRMSDPEDRCARFPWETVETGEEASPPGYWYEHIFHMANISCGAFDVYHYTGDETFLRETAYPLIRACACFYLRHSIYRVEGGKVIVGKCTDLERLGSGRENAYMTTCGVIHTLRLCRACAEILGTDDALAARCQENAQALQAALPAFPDRYAPYPGCADRSIAMLSGIFPYPCVPLSDEKQRAAIDDYLANEHKFGNMYAVGKGVNPWYAAWKAIIHAHYQDADAALSALLQAAENSGCFHEFWEIKEPACFTRPWFSTAAGMYLRAVGETLLQYRDHTLDLLPGLQGHGDVSFCLSCPAGAVRLTAKNYVIEELTVTRPDTMKKEKLAVHFPAAFTVAPALEKRAPGEGLHFQKP